MPIGPTSTANGKDDGPAGYPGLPYTCTFCGCMCDDVELVAADGKVVEAERACAVGRSILIGQPTTRQEAVAPRISGQVASEDEAVGEAARLLASARSPLILGLGRSTNEAVRKAVALADRSGATIEVGDAATAWPRIAAFQRGGAVGATLGEAKARADVIVFWACDPAKTHPRHFERYSADAPGRFVEGRRVVVLGSPDTLTAKRADLLVTVAPEHELALLLALRALVREAPLDPVRVEASTDQPLATLVELAEALQSARYGAWFCVGLAGRGPSEEAESRRQAITALVRELAKKTRFIHLGLGEPGNAHGAEAVVAWQTGFAPGVDLGGAPESYPNESSAAGRLDRGEFDAAVVVGGGFMDSLTSARREALKARPFVFIGDPSHEAFGRGSVALPAGAPGIDDAGTFARVDGVSLPVRPIRPPACPSEAEWLDRIAAEVVSRLAGRP